MESGIIRFTAPNLKYAKGFQIIGGGDHTVSYLRSGEWPYKIILSPEIRDRDTAANNF